MVASPFRTGMMTLAAGFAFIPTNLAMLLRCVRLPRDLQTHFRRRPRTRREPVARVGLRRQSKVGHARRHWELRSGAGARSTIPRHRADEHPQFYRLRRARVE